MSQYTNIERHFGKLLVRAVRDDGTRLMEKCQFKPKVYTVTNKPSGIKSFYDENLEEYFYNHPRELNNNDEFYGHRDIITGFIYEKFKDEPNPELVHKLFLDIEVQTAYVNAAGEKINTGFPKAHEAKYPINALTQYSTVDKKFHVFATLEWAKEKSVLSYTNDIVYNFYETEEELLKSWLQKWKLNYPDIVSGWNVLEFDIEYIINRLIILFGEKTASEISPWGIIERKTIKNTFKQEVNVWYIFGVSIIDYKEAYKKFTYKPREKYTLDFITGAELENERKLPYNGSLGALAIDNPCYFMDYNIHDVYLLVKLDHKLNLFGVIIEQAYFSGINFSDTFSPIKTWETIIFRKCADKNIVVPWSSKRQEREQYDGAYVHPPKTGLKKMIVSFDLTSLYPSINRQWSISRDAIITGHKYNTLKNEFMDICLKYNYEDLLQQFMNNNMVEYFVENNIPKEINEFLIENNAALSMNSQFFDISKDAIFSDIINTLFKLRKDNKKLSQQYKHDAQNEENITKQNELKRMSTVYDTKQLIFKILLNSLYGACGSPYFKYYMPALAEATTLNGQYVIRRSAKIVNDYINHIMQNSVNVNYIEYMDTDSLYVELYDVYTKFAKDKPMNTNEKTDFVDKICKQIERAALSPLYDNIHKDFNCHKDNVALNMDREVICVGFEKTGHCGFWTAKKRYALFVNDSEGYRYSEPSLKVMGLLPNSAMSQYTKDSLTEIISLIIKDDINAVREKESLIYENYLKQSIEEISIPRSVSDVTKYTDPKTGLPHTGKWTDPSGNIRNGGVPINSKAAIYYNFLIKEKQLNKKYQPIINGDKMKYVLLKPNIYNINVIGFKDSLPEEFELNEFVDYDTQYFKTIQKPIIDLLESCNLHLKQPPSMDDFF